MKDLRISYITKEGKVKFEGYNTIMEFTDYIEDHPNDNIVEGTHIHAEFFENPLHRKEFNTITELYNFCIKIMK